MSLPDITQAHPVGLRERIAAALLVYQLCIWPVMYMGYMYEIGPALPQTWPVILLTGLLLVLARVQPRPGSRGPTLGTIGSVGLYVWATVILLLATDVRETSSVAYGNFLTSHLVYAGGFLVAGLFLADAMRTLATRGGRLFFWATAGLLALVVILSAWFNPAREFLPWYVLGISKPETAAGGDFNYIVVSDLLAITALLVLSRLRSFVFRVAVTALSGLLIFWASSRSALVFFLLVAGMMLLIRWVRLPAWPKVLTAAVAIPLIAGIVVTAAPMLSEIQSLPGLERFSASNLEEDESLMLRQELATSGMIKLKQDWMLGHAMREVVEGRQGEYIHNWLSFWQAYGLGPFLLCCVLYALLLVQVTIAFLRNLSHRDLEFLFSVVWFVGLSIAFTRSYGTTHVWLVLAGVPAVLQHFSSAAERQVETESRLPLSTA